MRIRVPGLVVLNAMPRLAAQLALSLSLVACAPAWPASPTSSPSPAPSEQHAKVISVHDGDTLTVRISDEKETVRLLGINTPELESEDALSRDLAYRARDHARERALKRTVVLQRDPVADDRDKYGRLLRYVILPDGVNLNEEMVRQGYARAYTRFRFSLSARFWTAEREAKRARLGRWAREPVRPKQAEALSICP